MMKKIAKGTSEPSVPQITGDKRPIIRELTVLNDKKLYTLPLKYNTQTEIKYSYTLGLTANTNLETMRTPSVHVGSQLLDFLKNGA
jgi:hypothetical protein